MILWYNKKIVVENCIRCRMDLLTISITTIYSIYLLKSNPFICSVRRICSLPYLFSSPAGLLFIYVYGDFLLFLVHLFYLFLGILLLLHSALTTEPNSTGSFPSLMHEILNRYWGCLVIQNEITIHNICFRYSRKCCRQTGNTRRELKQNTK